MMTPPVYSHLVASSQVLAIVGSSAPRIYRNESEDGKTQRAYIVWRVISGVPGNYLADAPDIDNYRVQIDHYSPDAAECLALAAASRAALEPHGHQLGVVADERDRETGLYRYSFDFSFWTPR